MNVEWPEFSWETEPGNTDSRCYQMFSPYISRIGYTNKGRSYSIICPQQGAWIPGFGALNVEVTVTKQRGWVNEDNKELAADMIVKPKIWFSPSSHQNALFKAAWKLFEALSLIHPFPDKKEHAIELYTFLPGCEEQPIFPLLKGEVPTNRFVSPPFARHEAEAWTVGHLEVEIGEPVKTGDPFVDGFNELVMKVFNIGSGNMLQANNTLAWNVWFKEPALVDVEEWIDHAEKWRKSIDADHGSPTGPGTKPRFFDGKLFSPLEAEIEEVIREIIDYLFHHHRQVHRS